MAGPAGSDAEGGAMKRKRADAPALLKALKACISIMEQQALGRLEHATDAMLKERIYVSQDYELASGGRLCVYITIGMDPPPPDLLMIEGPRR